MPHSCPSRHVNFLGFNSIPTQMSSCLFCESTLWSRNGHTSSLHNGMYQQSHTCTSLPRRIFYNQFTIQCVCHFQLFTICSFLPSCHRYEMNVKTACSMQCANTETLTETKIQISAPSLHDSHRQPQKPKWKFYDHILYCLIFWNHLLIIFVCECAYGHVEVLYCLKEFFDAIHNSMLEAFSVFHDSLFSSTTTTHIHEMHWTTFHYSLSKRNKYSIHRTNNLLKSYKIKSKN
jgi:hypothetical protein